MVRCSDGSLYTGITKDVERRVGEHNSSKKGAKYTKTRRPVNLVFSCSVGTQSEALKLEYRVKKLSRKRKEAIIQNPLLMERLRPQTAA